MQSHAKAGSKGGRARTSAAALLALGILFLASLSVSACGGDEDGDAGGEATAPRVSQTTGFPRPSNRSLRALLGTMRQGPVLAPSVSLLEPGVNRFGFALFDRGNRQIGDLDVALYHAKALDEPAHGPFGARYEPIEIKPRYRSRQTSEDPDAARAVYVSRVRFTSPGSYTLAAVAELDERLVASSPIQVVVRSNSAVPAVGEPAVRVHTPTRDSVANIETIETRIPPDSMHEVDFAQALDENRPTVLLFSSPALCVSRVCGPVTDVAEQVKSEVDGVEFVHMEPYRDNDLDKGVRPQMRAWGLTTEPFAFAVGADGRVKERLEGAFSVRELREAVRALR